MTGIAEDVATHCAESCADKAMQELKYLCCYKSYVDDFQDEQKSLSAKRDTVLQDIKEAKDRNEDQIENEVQLWLDRANDLIQEDTKGKKKWFGLIPNCFRQYKRGKDLEGKTRRIKGLIEKSNDFPRVARFSGLPGIEFYASANFMQFEDRKLHYEKLQAALKDDKFMIGLHGLGGTGKTTMAIEVGKEVAESKVFDKVIFTTVSKDPNLKKIRDNIAKHLNLTFKEGMDESEQAQQMWKGIAEGEKRVLIVLDDAWEKLTLREIGIPLGRHGKGCCAILLTTRSRKVCGDMGCDETIELEVLNEKDAVDLFLSYSSQRIDDSSNDFKDVALGVVKECGRLPVAIVAVASAFKSRPLIEWKQGLERLRNPKSIHDVNEDLKDAYNSLRLSYDYLKNEEARKLFLLCSLFPEDYEIPIELLTRIARCLGLCGEANRYSTTRSHFTPIKNVLMDSCLLLKAENEAVKMHDLVREVALWIGDKLVQVAIDSSTTLMENIRYSSCNMIDFPDHFDGRKLEVLLLWISNNADSTTVKVSDCIFEGMENLKFLALMNWSNIRISCASLFQSHPSLINVRTLALKGFELGDLSILANLKRLESLELSNCSMIELPKEIRELEKLGLLEIVECHIERNNPFEVIGSCLQLEELYFVANRMDEDTCKSPSQITTFPNFERYQIKAWHGDSNYKVDFSISRYFDSNEHFEVNFSNKIFKSLVARAEVLKLDGDYYNRGWTNVVPDILPVKDDSKEDHLTSLCLQSMNGIKCLIGTERLRSGVAIFSKLVKLKLSNMDVRELCCGPYPVNFLKQLEKLNLSGCKNLEGSLFDKKLELCNLKSIRLHECSMTCLFHPFTAQSLKQLEMLHIENCSELRYIVAEEDHDPNQKSHDSMFLKLKHLEVESCLELEFILPIWFCKDLPLLESMKVRYCKKLKYIFGQYLEERDLHQMGKEAILQSLEEVRISELPNFMSIYAECYVPSDEVRKSSPSTRVEDGRSSLSRSPLCWFWPKSNALTIYHPSPSRNHNQNQGMKVNYVANRAHGIFTPPLYPYTHLRSLEISGLVGLKSLFTQSIASSLKLLEILKVGHCKTLKHIVIDKEDGHDSMNGNSIFPNLREVEVHFCRHVEYLFPAFYSKDFQCLESVSIAYVEKLTHVFGKCQADQNHNVQVDLNLPALKQLHLDNAPNMVSICAENCSMKKLYLEDIILKECPQLALETLIDLLVVGHKRQEDLSCKKALPQGKPLYNLQELPEFEDHKSYTSFQNLSRLRIKGCKQLKFILSASTSRMLQKLKTLHVSKCEELVSIIEEDEESNKHPTAPQQEYFPELRTIKVRHCKSMKYLFSIPSGKLPGLLHVDLEDSPQLGEVFRRKHGEGQELVMEDVFPRLYTIRLVNLRALHTICQGIDFHTAKWCYVHECPAISLTLANDSSEELIKLLHSFGRDSVYEDELDVSDKLLKILKTIKEHMMVNRAANIFLYKFDSPMSQQNNGSPNFAKSKEVSKEIAKEDSTTNSNSPNLTEEVRAECDGNFNKPLGQDCAKKLAKVDENLKATFGEGPFSEKYDIASSSTYSKPKIEKPYVLAPSKEFCGKESMGDQQALEEPTNQCSSKETSNEMATTRISPLDNLVHKASSSTPSELTISNQGIFASVEELCGKESMGDQQAPGESRGFNEAPQRVEEPTHECSSKETSNETALTIPTSITTPPPITSISSPKKPKTAALGTQVEREPGSPSITDQTAQGQIMVKQRETSIEDDLIRLFRIMRDCSDLEVGLPYVSNIAAFEDDKVAKAFADIDSSLKMDLNQIANSEEHTHRLKNALNFLSTHLSEEDPSSHGLVRGKIEYLHQEIQRILSSFKQANDSLDTFSKLKEKEKWIDEQHSQRMEAATTLVSEIHNTEDYRNKLKEHISKLQAELKSKEKEFEDCEAKLSCLGKKRKECVLETIGFMEEYESVKKDRSYVEDGQTKARQELRKLEDQWPSCMADLRKTALLLGILVKQKP